LKRKKNLAKEIFYVWGRFPHVVVSLQVQMKVGKFICLAAVTGRKEGR
jgi:hypothetical protein